MNLLVVFGLAFGFLGLVTAYPMDGKIVGGVETTIDDVPYQLELQAKTLGIIWSFECGAVVVGPSSVLTAGHCVKGHQAKGLRILAGSTSRGDGTVHLVETAVLHPDYSEYQGTAVNDVAYLKLETPLNLNENTQPISVSQEEPEEGDEATISGWGLTSETGVTPPANVRKVDVPIVSRADCTDAYGEDFITEAMICAGLPDGGKDSCSGDSGGPLVVNGTLAGLVSWGQGCAEPGYYGVYTNVALFSDWVAQQIATYEA